MNERNPFEKNSRAPDYDLPLEVSESLEEFKRQAKMQLEFGNSNIPDQIKEAVRSSLDLVDLQDFQEQVAENRFDLYSNKTPIEQFGTYLEIVFIGRHLGDIGQDVQENKKMETGQRLMFSNLVADLEELAGRVKISRGTIT